MNKSILSARIGAIFYVLWGVFHLIAARSVYDLAETIEPGMTQGRIMQCAFYLLFFALFGIVVALTSVWRNSRQGYWMNGVLIAIADIPFILFVLIPGYMPWWPGLVGPLLWTLAFLFTSFARLKHTAADAAHAGFPPAR
jgi:hypothetical protein